jgi:hypothetical protein
MKIIIIIQSLIILAGAYYIYTLSAPIVIDEPSPTITPALIIREGYTPPTANPPAVTESTTTIETGVSGPSDAGMEYPILDSEVEVR